MVARDGRAVHADFAFVATADSNTLLWDVLNAQQSKGLDIDLFKD